MQKLVVEGASYIDALQQAAQTGRDILRVRTRTTRIMLMPERVTSKHGNRVFGAERLRPVVSGHRVRRTFTLS